MRTLFRPILLSALAFALAGLPPARSWAACNLIPGTEKTFVGVLGTVNRPFAAPGESVEVRLRSCDTESVGFGATAADHTVTVVFQPSLGPAHAVVLSADAGCPGADLVGCAAALGAGATATCVSGPTAGLALVERNGEDRLRFRFPDTDLLRDGVDDDLPFTGDATIIATDAAGPLACGLAATSCGGAAGAVACVGSLFANDGACGTTVPEPTFPSFIALPPPNDYASACFDEAPPCTATAPEVRIAVDGAGNVFLPMSWGGILTASEGVPVPRLLRTRLRSPLPFLIPDQIFVDSFTPEGGLLPPIFEPQFDPTAIDPTLVTLFGSADAIYTVLRVGRTHGTCVGGARDTARCSAAPDCPGGTCEASCVGDPTILCSSDVECGANAPCGELFDLSPLVGDGPIVVPRPNLPPLEGFCQISGAPCTAHCGADGPCVNYAMQALLPVPLGGLEASEAVRSFTLRESIDGRDRNGDGDLLDSVVTLASRTTGLPEDIGVPSGCGLGPAQGRGVAEISEGGFRFPAVVADGDLVAFLEAEALQNGCDLNGDVDLLDVIPRAYVLGGGEIPWGANIVASTENLIDGRPLGVSDDTVFVRASEPASARREMVFVSQAGGLTPNHLSWVPVLSGDERFLLFTSRASNLLPPGEDTNVCGFSSPAPGNCPDLFLLELATGTIERINVATDGSEANGATGLTQLTFYVASNEAALSHDARYIAFPSFASNLIPGDTNGVADIFLRDRIAGTTELVSVALDGGPADGGSISKLTGISGDGRFVAFQSVATNLIANDTNGTADIFVRDRCESNGVAVPACTPSTKRVSVAQGGGQTTGPSTAPRLSADGRYVVFMSQAPEIVPGAQGNLFVHDRETGLNELAYDPVGAEDVVASFFPVDFHSITPDARFIAFATSDSGLLPPGADTNANSDIYVVDRLTRRAERISEQTTGASVSAGSFHPTLSPDGRFVTFLSFDDLSGANLDPGDDPDLWIADRQTGLIDRVSVRSDGSESSEALEFSTLGPDGGPYPVTNDGLVFFQSQQNDIVSPPQPMSGIFARRLDPTDPLGADTTLFPDGALDDTVLLALDTSGPTLHTLCPSGSTSIADGRAAFLRPESTTGTVACPAGSLNGDGDTTDDVVHLWDGASLANLGHAATHVSLSSDAVGALVSESGDGVDYNADGDQDDDVAQIRSLAAGPWQNSGQAADSLRVVGSRMVFLTPESDQGAVLNADGDLDDRILRVFDATTASLLDTSQPGEEFVVGDRQETLCGFRQLTAFRTSEASAGANLNGTSGDADLLDDVLQVFDLETGTLVNPGFAVTPCTIAECDPREPYRVAGSKVTFLTFEPDQNGLDLSGEGSTTDLVLNLYDFCTDTVTTIGRVLPGGNVDPLGVPERSRVFLSPTGRCEASNGCSEATPCGTGEICEAQVCENPGCIDSGRFCLSSGEECTDDADCADTCDLGLGECVLSGSSCSGDEDCEDFCEASPGTCGDSFQECFSDLDCGACRKSGAACATDFDCSTCVNAQPTTCADDADCPAGSRCLPTTLVAATGIDDFDSDGVPDDQDNCPRTFNPAQLDPDEDGVGAACDASPGTTPTPSASPGPSPSPSPSPSSSPSPSPSPSPGPSALPRKGQTLLLKDKLAVPEKRRVVWVAKDDALLAPAPASADDPTLAGGSLHLRNPATGEEQTFALPATGWQGLGKPAGAKGYKYKDKSGASGPCKAAVLKPGKMAKVVCQGDQILFSLDEPAQGSLDATLSIGGLSQCTHFGGDLKKDRPATAKKTGLFKAVKAPAPTGCP